MGKVKTYTAVNGKLPEKPDKIEDYESAGTVIAYSKFTNEERAQQKAKQKRVHEYNDLPSSILRAFKL